MRIGLLSTCNDTLIVQLKKCELTSTSCGRRKGQIHRARPSRSTSAENLKVHTEYVHSGGATTLTFIVDGVNAVSSFVMRSAVPWNMVVNLTTRRRRTENLLMSTSHFRTLWKQVSCTPRLLTSSSFCRSPSSLHSLIRLSCIPQSRQDLQRFERSVPSALLPILPALPCVHHVHTVCGAF